MITRTALIELSRRSWLVLALTCAAACDPSAEDGTSSDDAASSSGGGSSGTATSVSDAASTSSTGGSTSSASTGGAPPIEPACSVDVPRTVPLQAWVEPTAGQAPFVDALSGAESTIRVMVYEMGYGQILDTLKAKAMAGVSVQVILDVSKQSINQKYFDQLTAAGAQVKWSDPDFTYMHAKAMVIDDSIAIISTGNYLATQMAKERNYVVRDEDPADVVSLASIFDADWQDLTPDLSCTRLIVSPVNSRERLLEEPITSATTTLDIESMQLADTDVREAIVARKNAGVTVRIVLADPDWITANSSAAQYLASYGIEAKYLTTPLVHVKAIAVDGERAYLGSENLSYTSLDKNREVGVIAFEDDVLSLTAATFDTDWAAALAF